MQQSPTTYIKHIYTKLIYTNLFTQKKYIKIVITLLALRSYVVNYKNLN